MDELEALWESLQRPAEKAAPRRESPDPNYRISFNLDRWVYKGQVQLYHLAEETRTLLGLYDEFVHEKLQNCRRLVAAPQRREDVPLRMEEVQGPGWLPPKAWELRARQTERVVELIEDLAIELGQLLEAKAALVAAHTTGGALQRLLLREEAVFVGESPRTMLQTPPGTDLLEVLTHETKARLWSHIKEANSGSCH